MKLSANAMPAPTWHRLQMNDIALELAELPVADAAAVHVDSAEGERAEGAEGAFGEALAGLQERMDSAAADDTEDTRLVLAAARGEASADNLDIPSLSGWQASAVEHEVAGDVQPAYEAGSREAAEEYIAYVAREGQAARTLEVAAGEAARAVVHIDGRDGRVSASALDVVIGAGAALDLYVALDSPCGGTGTVGSLVRGYVGVDAALNLTFVQTLDDGWTALNDTGLVLDDRAQAQVSHTVLGGGVSVTGLACDLRGDESNIDVQTRYLGARAQKLDFNYIIHHRGKKTTCSLDANGVLADESKKTLRGTIDLAHGAKGAEGNERETVLLVGERAENKTVPVILCDEDDVAGNHGATIGHVRPEQLTYLMSRGLSQAAAEALVLSATLDWAMSRARDAQVRESVARVAAQLGVDVAAALEEDEEGTR